MQITYDIIIKVASGRKYTTYASTEIHNIATSYTSRLVLHHNGSSVNHTVYLQQYGFMATSELDLEFDWVKNW